MVDDHRIRVREENLLATILVDRGGYGTVLEQCRMLPLLVVPRELLPQLRGAAPAVELVRGVEVEEQVAVAVLPGVGPLGRASLPRGRHVLLPDGDCEQARSAPANLLGPHLLRRRVLGGGRLRLRHNGGASIRRKDDAMPRAPAALRSAPRCGGSRRDQRAAGQRPAARARLPRARGPRGVRRGLRRLAGLFARPGTAGRRSAPQAAPEPAEGRGRRRGGLENGRCGELRVPGRGRKGYGHYRELAVLQQGRLPPRARVQRCRRVRQEAVPRPDGERRTAGGDEAADHDRQGEAHADHRGQRRGHAEGGAGGEPGAHRPLGHRQLRAELAVGLGRREPHRPVRRRVLLCLPRGEQGRGRVQELQGGGCGPEGLEVDLPGQRVHHPARSRGGVLRRAERHEADPAPPRGGPGVLGHGEVVRPAEEVQRVHHVPDRVVEREGPVRPGARRVRPASEGGREAEDEERPALGLRVGGHEQDEAHLAAQSGGGEPVRVHRVLQDHLQGVRRALVDDALQGRGPDRVPGAHVHPSHYAF
mmetsp:Transcript_14282/g.40598  ORF Transcript_14282/g.40598 Transcript_14282/m.40598 type:complete len:534 (+) Transcript_14282:987-2588(+)